MKTFVIAEAGVNHNGSLDTALALVDAANAAGADAVKFQHFSSKRLWGDDRIAHLELTDAEMSAVADFCGSIGIEFMCTPFGIPELRFLRPRLKRIKIASGCIGRLDLLMAARDTGLPVILSTGMSTGGDIRCAISALNESSLTLLHCTSAYPCALADVNLRAMRSLKKFGWDYGYSDHTTSLSVPVAAVAMGAVVIEKHMTLDQDDDGPDHHASIVPLDFRHMVQMIREVEEALGDGEKRVLPCEEKLRGIWRGNQG